jgi:hypothetical protein
MWLERSDIRHRSTCVYNRYSSYLGGPEDVGQQEVEQGPELVQVVLQWRARNQQPVDQGLGVVQYTGGQSWMLTGDGSGSREGREKAWSSRS